MAGGRDVVAVDSGRRRSSGVSVWSDPSGLLRSFPYAEEPVVLLPVYLAFFLHYLAGFAPFGACRGCLPLCRSQLVARAAPPEVAAGLFNLGVLAVSMRMRMFPRRMWRQPPQSLFLVYKFVVSLFLFEICHSCIFKAVERTLYEGLPAACEVIMLGSAAYLDTQWLLESACGVLEADWVPWLAELGMAAAFLWCALDAARLNSLPQLHAHGVLAAAACASVVYKARAGPHCARHLWG